MKIRLCLLLLFCSFSQLTTAQYALKAIKKFEQGDINKGIERLSKGFEKNRTDPANYYVISVLYSSPTFYEDNIDSAHYYIKVANDLWFELPTKEKDRYARKGMDSLAINERSLKIDSLGFTLALKANTEDAYNHFLAVFINAKQRNKAEALRNEVAYEMALASNEPKALSAFFEKYPNAPQAEEARSAFENLYFKQRTESNTLTSYLNYIEERPETVFAEKAALLSLQLLSSGYDSAVFASFAQKYTRYEAGQLAQDFIDFLAREPDKSYLLTHFKDDTYHFFDIKRQQFLALEVNHVKPDSCKWITHELIAADSTSYTVLRNREGAEVLKIKGNSYELLKKGWVKWPDDAGYLFKIRHALNHEMMQNTGLNFTIFDAHYYATETAKGWHLYSVFGEKMLRVAVDSIWKERETFFFKKDDKIALASKNTFKKESKDDYLTLAFLYTAYEMFKDQIWLASNNYQTVLSQQDLSILLPLQRADIYSKGSFWIVSNESGKSIYSNEFVELSSGELQDFQIRDAALAIKRVGKWSKKPPGKADFMNLKYDSIRLFNSWLTYYELDDTRGLLFQDSTQLNLSDNEAFSILSTANMKAIESSGTVQFVQKTNDSKQSAIYNGEGRLIWQGESIDIKVLTANLIYIKARRKSYLIDAAGKSTELKGVKAIGTYDQGLVPLLMQNGKFGAYDTGNKAILASISSTKISVYTDSVYIFSDDEKYGLMDENEILLSADFDKLIPLNAQLLFALKEDKWQLIKWNDPNAINSEFYSVERINFREEVYFKVNTASGFGIINTEGEFMIPAIFNALDFVDISDNPFWVAERNIAELDYKVIGYYSKFGKLLFREGFTQAEFLINSCD